MLLIGLTHILYRLSVFKTLGKVPLSIQFRCKKLGYTPSNFCWFVWSPMNCSHFERKVTQKNLVWIHDLHQFHCFSSSSVSQKQDKQTSYCDTFHDVFPWCLIFWGPVVSFALNQRVQYRSWREGSHATSRQRIWGWWDQSGSDSTHGWRTQPPSLSTIVSTCWL